MMENKKGALSAPFLTKYSPKPKTMNFKTNACSTQRTLHGLRICFFGLQNDWSLIIG